MLWHAVADTPRHILIVLDHRRAPQRVCELCSSVLAPHQQMLAGTLAAAAQPPVQDAPDAISLRAWLNAPWSSNLEEDVFKAANMLQVGGCGC